MRAGIAWIVTLSSLSAPSFAADEMFFREAAQSGLEEVALGRLAASKGSTDNIKAFGRQMVEEHGAANTKLKAAAARSGVSLPTELPSDAQEMQRKLQSLSGNEFDLAYVESQSKAHAAAIHLLEKEVASGTDPAAKAWASETLPTVKRHAELVGTLRALPGDHDVEHAAGVPGPADAPRTPAPL